MNTIHTLFTVKELKGKFGLLVLTDFEKCMDFFEKSEEMQKHALKDACDTVMFDIENFPFGIAVISPQEKPSDQWNCVSRDTAISFGNSWGVKRKEILKALAVKGNKTALLYSKEGLEALGFS